MDPEIRSRLRNGAVACRFRDPGLPLCIDGFVQCKHRKLKFTANERFAYGGRDIGGASAFSTNSYGASSSTTKMEAGLSQLLPPTTCMYQDRHGDKNQMPNPGVPDDISDVDGSSDRLNYGILLYYRA
ncbi:unnamed protein product, partial [Amoebophrya sp. A120]|eukprot:GSA120T00010093001.1